MNSPINILAIESSCDETSAAVIQDGKVLSNHIATQKVHERFGGVVPELASRAHMHNIIPVVDAAIKDAGLSVPGDISLIGFDDIPMAAQSHPPLTTVRQPLVWMGRSAVNTLLAQIAGIGAASQRITLPAELVVRDSTGQVRKK